MHRCINHSTSQEQRERCHDGVTETQPETVVTAITVLVTVTTNTGSGAADHCWS